MKNLIIPKDWDNNECQIPVTYKNFDGEQWPIYGKKFKKEDRSCMPLMAIAQSEEIAKSIVHRYNLADLVPDLVEALEEAIGNWQTKGDGPEYDPMDKLQFCEATLAKARKQTGAI